MQVNEVTLNEWSDVVKLAAVCGGTPEDNSFCQATPSAEMTMRIDNPAVRGTVKPGQKFYVDFTPVAAMLMALLLLVLGVSTAPAQVISVSGSTIQQVLQLAGLSASLADNSLVKIGTPFTLTTPQGSQSFLISTNAAGLYTISTSGPAGTNSITPPSGLNGFIQQGTSWVNANDPLNITYYSTNEIDARVGVMYLQNSGQAAAVISLQKYGLFGAANIGIGGGILEGNNAGKQGTAGFYGEIDYRRPIGDVAAVGGLVAGYDNWNSTPFGGVKAGLEYRQSPHLGEWIDVVVAYEQKKSDLPMLIGGGITYSF